MPRPVIRKTTPICIDPYGRLSVQIPGCGFVPVSECDFEALEDGQPPQLPITGNQPADTAGPDDSPPNN